MATIPGPIITFRLNSPDLASATRSAMDQVRAQAKSTSDAIAADWQRMAAEHRAATATEKIGIDGIATARGKIVSVLESEIGLLRSKDALNRQELSSLRAMTRNCRFLTSVLSQMTERFPDLIQKLLLVFSPRLLENILARRNLRFEMGYAHSVRQTRSRFR